MLHQGCTKPKRAQVQKMGNHTVLGNRTENQMLDTEKNSERKISRNKLLVRGEKKAKMLINIHLQSKLNAHKD